MGHLTLLPGGTRYFKRVLSVEPQSLIGYWPLWEPSGTIAYDISRYARNGAHTGVTLGEPGIGDGRTSPLYDGSTDYTNIYSAALASAFNGAEGTLLVWAKVANSGVWTDAASRYLAILSVDGSNNIIGLEKASTNNTVQFIHIAGGTNDNYSLSGSPTSWVPYVITWSATGDAARAYAAGVLKNTATTLGTWSGALASSRTLIGARISTPGNVFSGTLAHAALWSKALIAAQIAYLSVV